MNFYVINSTGQQNTVSLFKRACRRRNIRLHLIRPETFDFTDPGAGPADGDSLYRITNSRHNTAASVIEKFLLRPQVATFYHSYQRALTRGQESSLLHLKTSLPLPETIPAITTNRHTLKKYVDRVGGFPLIIKVAGGSHGKGVIKIDSLSSLYSVVDFLHDKKRRLSMRRFIDVTSSARLIVIGDKAVASIEYTAPAGDFRSNATLRPSVRPRQYSAAINSLAVQAVRTTGVDFGGVDILIDRAGRPYITEVNFPCNFTRAQTATGVDIADLMLNYLQNKAASLSPPSSAYVN